MIASALRTEIQQFLATVSDRPAERDLARVAPRALVERQADDDLPSFLACQAACEYVSARLEGRSLDRFEAMLDALDDLVQDPAQLPPLRQQLRTYFDQLEQLCQDALRARRQPGLHVSAA